MIHSRRARVLLGAILASIPAMVLLEGANPAQAQSRVGEDGRANDANNRLGSGGYNSSRNVDQRSANITNSAIYHGDVTGLDYFHGRVEGFDPNVVNTNTETGASDRFNAIAGPVNYGVRTTAAPQQIVTQSFLPAAAVTSNQAQNSANYRQTSNGVGLIPAPRLTDQPNDTRLGLVNSVTSANYSPAVGELDLPGPVNPSGYQTALTASPLYGLRSWSPNDANDAYFLSRYSNVSIGNSNVGRADNATIQRMRDELTKTATDQNGPANPDNADQNNGAKGGAGGANALPSQQVGLAAESPKNQTLSAKPLGSAVNNNALSGNLGTNQGVQQRLMVPPAQQSTQLAELERRLAQSRGKMNDQQANNAYNQEVQLKSASDKAAEEKKQAETNAANSVANANTNPNNTAAGTARNPAQSGNAPITKDYSGANTAKKPEPAPLNPVVSGPLTHTGGQPYVITSLSTGIKAQGLADLLTSAEKQMREGKFSAALDTYDTAQQVAPNNPFIPLGRGFAELGASYYGKAESDLRRAFAAEPALLQGQYDLKGFIGENRLGFIENDLKNIYQNEKTERPALLLAYIEHNRGDDSQATGFLKAADQRADSKDPLIEEMKTAWAVK